MRGAIVAQRATLASHAYEILITPFVFFLAMSVIRFWKILMVLLIVSGLWLTGKIAGVSVPAPSPEQCAIFGGMVVFLWIVALFLSIADHFRYSGWMTVDGGPFAGGIGAFNTALLAEDWDVLQTLCSDDLRSRMDRRFFRKHGLQCLSRLGAARTELSLDEPGFWRLPILAKAVPHLSECFDDRTHAVVLVLYHDPHEELDRNHVSSLRLRLYRDGNDIRVDAFDVVEVALNQ